MNKKFNKNIFFGSILPYVLVVLIVFSVHTASTMVVLNALENNAINVVKNSLEASIEVIEENMNSIKETATAVSQNVYARLEGDKTREVYTRLVDAHSALKTYYVRNSVIKNICVQNDENDMLVSFDTVYSERINFYKSKLRSDSLSGEELLKNSETATGFSAEGISVFAEGGEVIPFFLPAPLIMKRTGSVSVYIDKKVLLLPMGDLLNENGGVLRVTNQDGKVLIEDGENALLIFKEISFENHPDKISFERKPYYVFEYTDKVSKWNYIMLVPKEYVMRDANYYQMISFVLNFLALAFGFALCFFFVLRKSSSYIELLEMLGLDLEKLQIKNVISKNEYKYLSQHISKIKDENAQLLERDNQHVLRMLLSGEFESEETILEELKKHNMEFFNSKYGVIVLYHKNKRLSESFEDNLNIFILREIQKIIPDAKVYFGERNNTVILFSVGEEDFEESVNMYISKLEIDVLFKYRIPVVIGVGNCTEELCNYSAIYKEARNVVAYNLLLEDKNVRFFKHLPENNTDYYYPTEFRNELFDSVLESNFENARSTLRRIQEENFNLRELSLEAIWELLTELRTDFKKIAKLRSEQLEFVQDNESVSHFFEYAISFFYLLCSDYEKEPKSRSKRICREVQRYIDEHYSDINLSLSSIADEFRMHPNYLSSMFKKTMNCSPVTYIETLRIEKATELLLEGKYSVNEIAHLVGFSNIGTFRRIFKKIKGVTPSNYFKS